MSEITKFKEINTWIIRVKIDKPKDSIQWKMGQQSLPPSEQNMRVKVQNDIRTSTHVYTQTNEKIFPLFNCVILDSVLLTRQ